MVRYTHLLIVHYNSLVLLAGKFQEIARGYERATEMNVQDEQKVVRHCLRRRVVLFILRIYQVHVCDASQVRKYESFLRNPIVGVPIRNRPWYSLTEYCDVNEP